MKYICSLLVFFLITSCQDEEFGVVDIRVNHYKQSAIGVAPTFVLLIQEGDKIGTDEWQFHYSGITGFDYEWGYVYDLKIRKSPVDNPPADGSSVEYTLEEIISKKAIEPGSTFEIQLKSSIKGIKDLVTIDEESEYTLLNELSIDCSNLCEQLGEYLINKNELTGVFTYINSEKIELQELLFE